jgi:predicted nucleic acid-binding protein
MIAVSNTSPLIALSKIGYLVYLRELFERVYIPKSFLWLKQLTLTNPETRLNFCFTPSPI